MTEATYVPSLPEYDGNLFIAALPPLQDQKSLYKALLSGPLFDEREKRYPSYVRKHCIIRLARCFLPQARQLDLADRFGMLLRQGYVGRDPSTTAYLHRLHNGLDRIQAGSLAAPVRHQIQNTASSFALIGCPGVGKTTAMNRVLSQYPQTVYHNEPFSLVQIVWLRLEAPALGSVEQLCVDFFAAIDELIGTDYLKRYATRVGDEQIMSHMAHVAQLHGLGALVIDEIQHLSGVKAGADEVLKFMVRLVNTIGVPVIPIGTLGALDILQGSFSQARRSTGLGSLHWDRMAPDEVWDHFLRQLWRYQWTNPATELTPEISGVFYDETQGVADLAVKLFMLVQLRVVTASEVRRNRSEQLTEKLIRLVAKDEFALVRPMIEALRANDRVKLSRFSDLRSLDDHIGQIVSQTITKPVLPIPIAAVATEVPPPVTGEALEEKLVHVLVGLGVAEDAAQAMAKEQVAESPSGDPVELIQQIIATLTIPAKKVRKKKSKPQSEADQPANDLRRLVREGEMAGATAYEALLKANMVCSPLTDFAA